MLKTQIKKKAEKKILINVKVTEAELASITKKAKKYANGNVSAWVRYSAIELEAKKSDLVK